MDSNLSHRKTAPKVATAGVGLDLILVERSEFERIQAELVKLRSAVECFTEGTQLRESAESNPPRPPIID